MKVMQAMETDMQYMYCSVKKVNVSFGNILQLLIGCCCCLLLFQHMIAQTLRMIKYCRCKPLGMP